jgi:hypothetical protein
VIAPLLAAATRTRCIVDAVARDRRGLALLEFAIVIPVLLTLSLTGAELTNYIGTRMRLSQVALQIADNAARMGTGTLLTSKSVSETDINDVLTGGALQSNGLDLYNRGRVIISDLEPMANPNTTPPKFKIVWQRCRGTKTAHASGYGVAGDTNLVGIGPTGRKVTAQDYNATMFVEVYYEYKPLIRTGLAPSTTMVETASMAVRDRRDLTQIYNNENAAVSGC